MRDNFSRNIVELVAKRVGYRCSNPDCEKSTSGPSTVLDETVNIGVAAHITAASPRGPRFNSNIPTDERASIDNAIWLCQNCSKLVDNDVSRYSVEKLFGWKAEAENRAFTRLSHAVSHQSQNDILNNGNTWTQQINEYRSSCLKHWSRLPLSQINGGYTGRNEHLHCLQDILIDLPVTVLKPEQKGDNGFYLIESRSDSAQAQLDCMNNTRVIVCGNGGEGKTSLLRGICIGWSNSYEEAQESGDIDRLYSPIPILIEIRSFVGEMQRTLGLPIAEPIENIFDYLTKSRGRGWNFVDHDLKIALTTGGVRLLIDGLDEVFNPIIRQRIRDWILTVGRMYPKTQIIVSTRTIEFDQRDWWANFKEAREWSVLKLGRLGTSSARNLISKWLIKNKESPIDIEAAVTKILEAPHLRVIVINPLTMMLYCELLQRGLSICSVSDLYDKTVRLFIGNWDYSKDLPNQTNDVTNEYKNFGEVGRLAFFLNCAAVMWQKTQYATRVKSRPFSTSVLGTDLIHILRDQLLSSNCSNPDNLSRALLDLILLRNCLLEERGNQYTFFHRSFLDYFYAVYLIDSDISRKSVTSKQIYKKFLVPLLETTEYLSASYFLCQLAPKGQVLGALVLSLESLGLPRLFPGRNTRKIRRNLEIFGATRTLFESISWSDVDKIKGNSDFIRCNTLMSLFKTETLSFALSSWSANESPQRRRVNKSIREQAASILYRLNNPDDVQIILQCFYSDEVNIISGGSIVSILINSEVDRREILDLILSALLSISPNRIEPANSSAVRLRAINAISHHFLAEREALEALILCAFGSPLKNISPDPEVCIRTAAMQALTGISRDLRWEFQTNLVEDVLMTSKNQAALINYDTIARVFAIEIIEFCKLNHEIFFSTLVEIVSGSTNLGIHLGKHEKVRASAIRVLSNIWPTDSRTLPVLIAAVDDDNSSLVRCAAIRALPLSAEFSASRTEIGVRLAVGASRDDVVSVRNAALETIVPTMLTANQRILLIGSLVNFRKKVTRSAARFWREPSCENRAILIKKLTPTVDNATKFAFIGICFGDPSRSFTCDNSEKLKLLALHGLKFNYGDDTDVLIACLSAIQHHNIIRVSNNITSVVPRAALNLILESTLRTNGDSLSRVLEILSVNFEERLINVAIALSNMEKEELESLRRLTSEAWARSPHRKTKYAMSRTWSWS